MTNDQSKILPALPTSQKLNKVRQQLAIRRSQDYAADYVPHWGIGEVKTLAETVLENRQGERDRLLILTLCDACLRVSEAISLCPQDIELTASGWQLKIHGLKGSGHTIVAISPSLAAQLQAYAYRNQVKPTERLFPITRWRVFQIVAQAARKAGLTRPKNVGAVHILRHSGAIERLRRTGNPKALQEQLRHKSALMTLRYMKTLSHEESVQIQQGVDFQW